MQEELKTSYRFLVYEQSGEIVGMVERELRKKLTLSTHGGA
jgi:hypothetical protein